MAQRKILRFKHLLPTHLRFLLAACQLASSWVQPIWGWVGREKPKYFSSHLCASEGSGLGIVTTMPPGSTTPCPPSFQCGTCFTGSLPLGSSHLLPLSIPSKGDSSCLLLPNFGLPYGSLFGFSVCHHLCSQFLTLYSLSFKYSEWFVLSLLDPN